MEDSKKPRVESRFRDANRELVESMIRDHCFDHALGVGTTRCTTENLSRAVHLIREHPIYHAIQNVPYELQSYSDDLDRLRLVATEILTREVGVAYPGSKRP